MPCVVRELGVTPSEYYDLPSTDDYLDLSQRGLDNEREGSIPREGRSGLCESGVERWRWEDTGSCQGGMPPIEELLALAGEESLLRDGFPPVNTPASHIGQFTQRLIDDALGTQLSWLQKDPPETGEELRLLPGMSGVETQSGVEDGEVNGQGHFLAKKYGFIQTRVDELLKPHGDGSARVTHGLAEKPVGLPPLSLVDQYLIALQIEYLGGPLDKVLELKARGRPISLKRTAQNAKLDKGLASRILSPENHNTRQPERILRGAAGGVAGGSEAMTDTPRKKRKDNWRARGCVIASVTDSSMQSQQFSQASITIPETPIGHLQSLNSSPPGPKYPSTAELAGVFFRATEEREEKQSTFQEELLAEMRKQTTAVQEMVRIVKELYDGRSASRA